MCYVTFQECVHNNQYYFTAIPFKIYTGSSGGDWSVLPQVSIKYKKYVAASCDAPVEQSACWPKHVPIHVSDGGPTDLVRENEVKETIRLMVDSLIPT